MQSREWARKVQTLLVLPLVELVLGAERAGLTSALVEVGIDEQFLADLPAQMRRSRSALVVLTSPVDRDRVLASISGFGGTVLRTSVPLPVGDVPRAVSASATAGGRARRPRRARPATPSG